MANCLASATHPIRSISVSAYAIPTDFPESDGTLQWDKTTLVLVEASCGEVTGLGYTYADVSTAKLVDSLLRNVVQGRDAMDISGMGLAMRQAIRNLGRPGIASMAISAVDIALWDLKAKLLKLPLLSLLGAVRTGIPIYGSGGFTSYSINQLQRQLQGWVESGIGMVKMKVGRNPNEDPERVRSAREAIGKDAALFVDANGAYTRRQALHLADRFWEADVTWFEEPVSSDDLVGLRFIGTRCPAPMQIAAGEYGYDSHYFRAMLDAGAVDVLQADATRCGGITGFLEVAALCEARSMPLSAHTAPSIHAPLCCAASNAIHVEYFHDHARIENMFFDGAQRSANGELMPDLTRPGLGLEIRRADISRYEVS